METIRTFIALELPEPLRKRLGQLQQNLPRGSTGIRWTKPENIHLTLKFIGSTYPQQVKEVRAIVSSISSQMPAFAVRCRGLGAFPNARNPKVVWAGLQAGESLAAFQADIERALESLGIAREKRTFSPHLTLGRVKDTRMRKQLAGMLDRYADEDWGSHVFARVVFYRSDLYPTGPVYSPLHTADLLPQL